MVIRHKKGEHMNENYEKEIGSLLVNLNLKLVVAESCTGGLISHRITNIAGSSEYFMGGVCAYAYEAKRTILGVKPETLNNFGAVSKETVFEMANGVRKLFSKELPIEMLIGLSVSGIAGPGGGTPEKPVGLVWFGLATPVGSWTFSQLFSGNRKQIKEQSSDFGLRILMKFLNDGQTENFEVNFAK